MDPKSGFKVDLILTKDLTLLEIVSEFARLEFGSTYLYNFVFVQILFI